MIAARPTVAPGSSTNPPSRSATGRSQFGSLISGCMVQLRGIEQPVAEQAHDLMLELADEACDGRKVRPGICRQRHEHHVASARLGTFNDLVGIRQRNHLGLIQVVVLVSSIERSSNVSRCPLYPSRSQIPSTKWTFSTTSTAAFQRRPIKPAISQHTAATSGGSKIVAQLPPPLTTTSQIGKPPTANACYAAVPKVSAPERSALGAAKSNPHMVVRGSGRYR